MTLKRDGVEYLSDTEWDVYQAVKDLNRQGRTTNNSQLAAQTRLSHTSVSQATSSLRARGYLRDVSKGAAYHWRTTGKPVRKFTDPVSSEPSAPHAQYAAQHGAITYLAGSTTVDATDLAAEAFAQKLAWDTGHDYAVATGADGSLVVGLYSELSVDAARVLNLRSVKYASTERSA